MSEEGIPQEIRAFIADHIDSVVQLEVLLLLYNPPQKAWSASDIARELRIDPAWAEAQLADLCTRGLLSCPEDEAQLYRYNPASKAQDEAVKGLIVAYDQRRVSVINLIYSKPIDKLKSFADAFRLRKDLPDG